MSKYNINECFGIRAHVVAPVNKPAVSFAGFALSHAHEVLNRIDGITYDTYKIDSKGAQIDVHVIRPSSLAGKLPCIIDIHGGGFVFDGAPHQYELAARYVRETGSVVVFPRYRLTPKNKYPSQIDDCYSTYDWVKANADMLYIDESKVSVMGDSAGGYLAAMTVNYAVSKGNKIDYQLLIYPVIDSLMSTNSMAEYVDTPVWNAKNNRSMWRMYFGKQDVDKGEHSLLKIKLPDGIPRTYIETAEFDCLHDEGLLYAERLRECGVNVSVYETRETMHGFDEMSCEITEAAINKRIGFINENRYRIY